jgi:2-iminobutanoate/2-iminopropanoate deaminase
LPYNQRKNKSIEVYMKKVITTQKAPKAIGPYSLAIQTGQLVYTSGQIGLDPETGELVSGGIDAETRQVLTNLRNVLEASGSSLGDVIKTTVFLRDMADFAKMNGIYAEFFNQNPPARSTVAVAGLPKGGSIEIEVVATLREYA